MAVNLVLDGENESEEDEEWWVGTVGVEDAGEEEDQEDQEDQEDKGDQEDAGEGEEEDQEDKEDELEHQWKAPIPPLYSWLDGSEWCSPKPPESSSSEDEEEIRYLMEIKGSKPHGAETEQGELPRTPHGEGLLCGKNIRRRKLRKKVTKNRDCEWELARQDAWLREALTESSGSESEEDNARFAESGRWIAEMTGIQVEDNDDLKRGVFRTEEVGFLKSS
jgi:hypothetical protein